MLCSEDWYTLKKKKKNKEGKGNLPIIKLCDFYFHNLLICVPFFKHTIKKKLLFPPNCYLLYFESTIFIRQLVHLAS